MTRRMMSESVRWRLGIDLQTATPEEQQAAAARTLAEADGAAPARPERFSGLLDALPEPPVDRAARRLIYLWDRFGPYFASPGGTRLRLLPGPIATFITPLVQTILEEVPAGQRRHVFG